MCIRDSLYSLGKLTARHVRASRPDTSNQIYTAPCTFATRRRHAGAHPDRPLSPSIQYGIPLPDAVRRVNQVSPFGPPSGSMPTSNGPTESRNDALRDEYSGDDRGHSGRWRVRGVQNARTTTAVRSTRGNCPSAIVCPLRRLEY